MTQALFDQVQEINQAELERRAAYDTLDNPDPDYRDIFRGKVFCGECGARMTAGILAGKRLQFQSTLIVINIGTPTIAGAAIITSGRKL